MLSAREVFDRVDDAVSTVVLRAVNTPEVARALLDASRVAHGALTRLDELRGAAVHLLALPSQHDVEGLRHEVVALRTTLAEVEARLAELGEDR